MFPVNRVEAAIAALAVASSLLVAWATWNFGVAVYSDSFQYISAARNLANLATGNGHYPGADLPALWPPLFIAVLAAPGVFGVDPLVTAGVVNPLILGLICLVAGSWLQRVTAAPRLSVAVTAVIAFSIPLTRVASTVWTEPLFILLTVLSLIYVVRFIEEDSPRRLYLSAALAALACLTRYAGVALVASTLLVLLVAGRRALPRTLGRMAVYAAIATVPLGLWLVRNWLLTATLTGDRIPAEFSVIYNLARTVGTLAVWAIPCTRGAAELVADRLYELQIGMGGAVSALVFAGMTLAVLAAARLVAARHGLRDGAARLGLASPFFGVLICYAGVYLVFIVAASSAVRLDNLSDRLLAPVFVPLALAAGLVGTNLAEVAGKAAPQRLGRRWFTWAGAAWLAAYVVCCAPELQRWLDSPHASQLN